MLPGIPDKVSGYDKITVIQICLKGRSEKKENTESELTGMLNVLFDSEMDSEKENQVFGRRVSHRNGDKVGEGVESDV